jgi:phage baseplate assembly protein W
MASYRFRSEKFTSRGFRDLSISFSQNPTTNDFGTVKNENSIKQSIRNLLLTSLGERPFQPEIGSKLAGLLFEPYDAFLEEDIKEEIYNTVQRLEPRVQLQDVRIYSAEDNNELNVEIDYTIVGQSIIQTVEFLLERT